MTEKPLHVQVAEAIGWTDIRATLAYSGGGLGGWMGHYLDDRGDEVEVPRYDTDWSATGPLIERYGITLTHNPCKRHAGCDEFPWDAAMHEDGPTEAGTTALLAVCDLIVMLKAAGEL